MSENTMSENMMSELTITKTDPIDGKETFIFSTRTLQYQLCIPPEVKSGEVSAYRKMVADLRYHIEEGHTALAQTLHRLECLSRELASPYKAPMRDLYLKLSAHSDEFWLLRNFLCLSSPRPEELGNLYGFWQSQADWFNYDNLNLEGQYDDLE
ncbi:MAG: hypothetical protein Q9226_008826 [Calogaya cf. arnoldii]